MDGLKVRANIEKYLSGKYKPPIDDFCLYQWLERCVYHKWVKLGLNVFKFIHLEKFDKPYQERIQYLAKDLQRQLVEQPKHVRLIDLLEPRGKRRRTRGQITNMTVFRPVIIETLKQLGGVGRLKIIAQMVENKMNDILTEEDYTIRSSDGRPVWYNTMNWERYLMVQEGILKKDSPRGIWELSNQHLEQEST